MINRSRAPPPLDLKQKTRFQIQEDKRWTETKMYGKISIKNDTLKSGADGE